MDTTMKSILVILSLLTVMSCVTSPEYEFQNTETAKGYISNEHHEPVVFVTADTSLFIYEYDFNPTNVRVEREIVYRKEGNKNIFVAELVK